MPIRPYAGRALMDEEMARKKKRYNLIHLWWDYVPNSFIEPHSYFRLDPHFSSQNLVCHLWNNGKAPDQSTFYLHQNGADKLVAPPLLFRILNRLLKPWRWAQFRRFARARFAKSAPALVHSHFGTTGCQMSPLVHSAGLPHIVTIYGYDGSAALLQPKTVEKYKEMFKTAHKIVVLCETVRQRFLELGCAPSKVTVWNMPAGVERYPLRSRTSGDALRLVMAARFAEAKGHVYLLEAISKLIARGHNLHLTLIGYGNRVGQAQRMVERLRLGNHVTLIDNKLTGDFHQSYRSILEQSDLYVLPSIRDSHGTDEAGPSLTMICAQASGIPVICTPFPGSEVSLIPGETGLYCEEKNADSIAEKIEFFIKHPHELEKMGKRGSALVNREFSEWTQMDKLTRIYEEALGIELLPYGEPPGQPNASSQGWIPRMQPPSQFLAEDHF